MKPDIIIVEPLCSQCAHWNTDIIRAHEIFCMKIGRWIPDMVREDEIECPSYEMNYI